MDDMDDQLGRILTTLTVRPVFVGGMVCLGFVGQLIAKRSGSPEGFWAGPLLGPLGWLIVGIA